MSKSRNFATQITSNSLAMTNVQLRAELFREINPLLDNEAAIKKIILFIKSFSPADKLSPADEEQPKIKLKDLKIPAKLRQKRGCIKLTEEDLKDEHIQYILNR